MKNIGEYELYEALKWSIARNDWDRASRIADKILKLKGY